MKKTKFLLVVATLLVFVTMFNSCGTISSVNKFLNKDYQPSEDVYKSESTISELTGYGLFKSNGCFAIFISENTETVSYKVFSLKANRIIATFADIESVFTFDLFDDVPLLLVAKTAKSDASVEDVGDGIDAVINVTYTAYDAIGEILKTFEKYKPADPKKINFDTCLFDYASYTINQDGSLSKTVDIPEYVIIDHIRNWNDDYYYNYGTNNTITVYDHSFNIVSTYVAPSYYETASIAVLNNGNILAQYMYEVDEDERKYDISICKNGHTAKYDLVSMIITAKNGKSTEVNLDYIIEECYSNYEINKYYNAWGETSPYNDDFENIATICPIVDKKLDDDRSNHDIVFMNNKGKALDSLKLVDGQMPNLHSIKKIGNDRYLVDTIAGSSIIDANGKVIKNMNTDLDVCGAYFVSDRAIYNLDLEIVYDLIENDAVVVDIINNTIFVQANTDTGYDIISFCNGDQTTVCTYKNTSNDTTVFNIIDGVGYSLINTTANDYKYYNSEGTLLLTTTYALESITSTDNDIVIMKAVGSSSYHTFSK